MELHQSADENQFCETHRQADFFLLPAHAVYIYHTIYLTQFATPLRMNTVSCT